MLYYNELEMSWPWLGSCFVGFSNLSILKNVIYGAAWPIFWPMAFARAYLKDDAVVRVAVVDKIYNRKNNYMWRILINALKKI